MQSHIKDSVVKIIKTDSVPSETHFLIDSVKSMNIKIRSKISLPRVNSDSIFHQLNNNLSIQPKEFSIVNGDQNAVDKRFSVAEKQLSVPIDSLNKVVNTTVVSVERKIFRPIDSLQQIVNKKQNLLQGNGIPIDKGNLENLDLGNEMKPVSDKLSISESDKIDIPNPDLNLKEKQGVFKRNEIIPEMNGVKLPEVNDIKILNATEDLKSGISEGASKVEKAEGFIKDGENVLKGDYDQVKELPKQVEEKAMQLAGAKELQEKSGKLAAAQKSYEALIQKYNDKKLLQQELKEKSMSLVNEKFNKETPGVKLAQSTMQKAKRKYGNFESLKDLSLRKTNEMSGKPFYQRLLPGVSIQVFHSDKMILDASPQIGYRFTQNISAGVAYTYRFGLSNSYHLGIRNQGLYGGRTFIQVKIIKTIFVQTELEYLHISKRGFNNLLFQENRKSDVLQTNLAIGKFFNLSPKIRAHALALYRLEWTGTLPRQNKLNLRFGIEYMFANARKSKTSNQLRLK